MKKIKNYGGLHGLIGLVILVGLLAAGCREDKWDESIEVEIERYVNNNLVLTLLINGQKVNTVYKDSMFHVQAHVNLYAKDSGNYYEIRLNNQTFYKNNFYDSLSQIGIYLVTVMATNGGRTFRDTAEIYAVNYPVTTIWLPGLWGDNTDSSRFRIGIDTLFFNSAFCPSRELPFAIFADSVSGGKLVFSKKWMEFLRFYNNIYNTTWYYLAYNNLDYWFDMPDGTQFLFVRYGGDYYNTDSTMADMKGGTLNEDLQCYVIRTSFIRKPKIP